MHLRRFFCLAKGILAGSALLLIASSSAQAYLVKFNFTGTIFSTFGVPNAGTTVSGYVMFDPFASLSATCAPDCGVYPQSAPATFFFETDAGFTLQQTLTNIGIADKFANGITDYYVFDADVGTFSASTNFSRLELTLSNNQNPFIPNISIPTMAPDFSAFQFHTVAFFGFTGNTASQRVEASLTSLTAVVVTPPVITPTITGTLGTNGWYTSNVTVSWSVTDPESGIASSLGCGTSTLTAETAGVTLTCSALDGAGLSSSVPITIKIDKTSPVITASATKADSSVYSAGAWSNQTIAIHFSCSDSGSGIATCPANRVLSVEGVTVTVSGTSTDNAGNVASASLGPIQIDKTAPALNPVVSPNPVALNAAATVISGAADALSGLASQSCGPVVTTSVGTKSVTCTASDNAGNTSSANASYVVTAPTGVTLFITNYQLVSQQSVSGGLVNSTYRADLVNFGKPLGAVTATLYTSDPSNIRMVPGQTTLTFGPILTNAQTTSTNTFSILVKPTVAIDFTKLQWTFQTTAAPPIANPGPNQTVQVGSTVTLDGSGSSNPSGIGTLTYDWRFTLRPAGSTVRLSNSSGVMPTFVPNAAGNYVITLTVSNGTDTSSASVTVTAVVPSTQ